MSKSDTSAACDNAEEILINNDIPINTDNDEIRSLEDDPHWRGDGTYCAKRSASWFLTIPNPSKWFAMPDASPEQLLQHALDKWTRTKRGEERANRAAAGCFEIGVKSGTPHIHLVCVAVSRVRFDHLVKMFSAIDPDLEPGDEKYGRPKCYAHIQPTYGSIEDQEAYLKKEGKYSTKAEQTVIPMVYQGNTPLVDGRIANPLSMLGKTDTYSRSYVLREIDTMIKEGHTPWEIENKSIKYKVYREALNAMYYDRRKEEIPALRDVTVVYHCGESGTGKSYCRLKYEQEDPHQIYIPAPDGHIWDGYQMQKILFLDEYRANQIRWDMFLRVLDRYRLTLPARYSNKEAAWERVEITTTVPIEALYVNKTSSVFAPEKRAIMSEDEMLEAKRERHDNFSQLMRRVDWVIYHYIDPFFDGPDRYQTIEIPGRAYRCIEQAERYARARLDVHERMIRGGMFVSQDSLLNLIDEQQKELTAEAALAEVPGVQSDREFSSKNF